MPPKLGSPSRKSDMAQRKNSRLAADTKNTRVFSTKNPDHRCTSPLSLGEKGWAKGGERSKEPGDNGGHPRQITPRAGTANGSKIASVL